MFRRSLMFLLFVALAAVIWVQSTRLFLTFFVLFPLLIFPVFYFYQKKDRYFLVGASLITVGIYGIYLVRHLSLEIFLLGLGLVGTLGILMFYKLRWDSVLQEADSGEQRSFQDLQTLKEKHDSRLESLHHLEHQVSGLLDLFEIARDFGECLSFDTLVEVISKKVIPELPCSQMLLILRTKTQQENYFDQIYAVTEKQARKTEHSLSDRETEILERVKKTRQLLQEADIWYFPLLMNAGFSSYLVVKEGSKNDLAKFEVLASYLALQVKKVRLYEEVRELAIRDGLTGVFVRRHFLERFGEELKRSIKHRLPFAVLMLDIDHFKRYNDDYGHLAGDATLKQVGEILQQNLRKVDIVARYGGEEFVVVIPESKKEGAVEAAERIRSSIARHLFDAFRQQTRVTVSIGISLYPNDVLDRLEKEKHNTLVDELIRHADEALYRAKEEGRNRVVVYQDM